ncbi:helix-turn-helix transcriptional regulator [Macrococcoides goetzii]|uniref:helix-turn-helix transcriptional regulator n=1 Tax=Macrococcus sp. PK TaxID=2801919 RepID=UPI001F11167A|nr:helix-turn-helix transcriptional regulator [Macrococcus sp. PK]MCH4984908.1 helix-turn-helix transcriptional regulator [Macrococcus sp. PK]
MKHYKLWIARMEKNMSQREVVKRIGISQGRYGLKESKKASFTLEECQKLAKLFDMTIDELFNSESMVS